MKSNSIGSDRRYDNQPPVQSKIQAKEKTLFERSGSHRVNINSLINHVKHFFQKISSASNAIPQRVLGTKTYIRGTNVIIGRARHAETMDPMAHAKGCFRRRFGNAIPDIVDIVANRSADPQALAICRAVVAGSTVNSIIDCMVALDDLHQDPSLEKAQALQERFILDPAKDEVFSFDQAPSEGLNIYKEAYDNFMKDFQGVVELAQASGNEEDLSKVVSAFDVHITPLLKKDARQFGTNAQALMGKHYASRSAPVIGPGVNGLA